jgi:hypothetical protein
MKIHFWLLTFLTFCISSCKSGFHLFVQDAHFVNKKQGYVLLERSEQDTIYADDEYLNRLANSQNKFKVLFFEMEVDTSNLNRKMLADIITNKSYAIELGNICSSSYDNLINKYSDTLSVSQRQTIYILPVTIRWINEKIGIKENETITIKLNNNIKKDINVQFGKLTLVSIEPIITSHMVERLSHR